MLAGQTAQQKERSDNNMEKTKQKIRKALNVYKNSPLTRNEYIAVVEMIKNNRRDLMDEKFGGIKGDQMIERLLLEYPETLVAMFSSVFEKSDWDYLDSKVGARWFAREFPEFRVPDKI